MNISRVFDSTLTLFNQKTNVILIDANTGITITSVLLNKTLLPSEFNKPTVIKIDDKKWQVLKVKEQDKGSYFSKKKLTFHVMPVDTFTSQQTFIVATMAHIDTTTGYPTKPLFDEFTLDLTATDWLQLELLPASCIDTITSHILEVESILNSPDDYNHLLGYDKCYIRNLSNISLGIPIGDFCNSIVPKRKGNVQLKDLNFLKDSFCIESENYIYYGIINEGFITKLAILEYGSFDEEMHTLLEKHDLFFVDWANAYILK